MATVVATLWCGLFDRCAKCKEESVTHSFGSSGDPDLERALATFEDDLRITQEAEELYLRTGDQEALDIATAAWLRILEHPAFSSSTRRFRALALYNAGTVLLRRYWASGIIGNLNDALDLFHQAVRATPPGFPYLHLILSSLGTGLREQFARTGRETYLEEAIRAFQQAVETTTPDSPDVPSILSNLGTGLRERFARTGQEADLDEAIRVFQQAVQATPADSPNLSSYLDNLGSSLRDRFARTGREADLEEAIRVWQEAAQAIPPQSAERQNLNSLEVAMRRRMAIYGSEGEKSSVAGIPDKARGTDDRATIIRIFYGTDRKRLDTTSMPTFRGERSDSDRLTLGICHVSIPPTHRTGALEAPKWWKLQFSSNPRKHVTLRKTAVLPEDSFYDLLRECTRGSDKQDAFVFVHGFNVSFEDAARRTAQLAFDLEFKGAPIMFSWPSCARVKGYMVDEATIDWVLPHLTQFLQDIVRRGEVRTLHLIAHSMGNRALARTLKEIAMSDSDIRFNQVLMAAPDIDRGEFLQLAARMKVVSERVTLYASSADKALRASQSLHHYPRAGEAGDNIVVTPEVDTIDASSVDTDFLAHSYFCQDRTLLNDIFYLVKEGKPPGTRFGLDFKQWLSGAYWVFRR